MKAKYISKDGEIIRTKDDKVVATIDKDGKVTPTAPVYYKILDELEKAAHGAKKEEKPLIKEAPEIEAPKETKETKETKVTKVTKVKVTTFKLVNIPPGHPQIPAAADHLHSLYKSMKGQKEAEIWKAIGRAALGMTLPGTGTNVDKLPLGGPKMDPGMGARTKGYPTWLLSVDPELARKLYEDRSCPEYDEAIKNL